MSQTKARCDRKLIERRPSPARALWSIIRLTRDRAGGMRESSFQLFSFAL